MAASEPGSRRSADTRGPCPPADQGLRAAHVPASRRKEELRRRSECMQCDNWYLTISGPRAKTHSMALPTNDISHKVLARRLSAG